MAGVDILATALNGGNASFIAEMYARWVEDPSRVDSSFAELFGAMNDETRAILTKEYLWDISTPEWMQHDIPQLDDEDSVLLREFQLFKA